MAKRKIHKSQYIIIFHLHLDGYQNKDIAKEFNVNPSCISKILHRKCEVRTDRRGERNANSKLKKEEVQKIALFRERGYTYGTISAIFGVGKSACSRIINKKSWKNV